MLIDFIMQTFDLCRCILVMCSVLWMVLYSLCKCVVGGDIECRSEHYVEDYGVWECMMCDNVWCVKVYGVWRCMTRICMVCGGA